MINRVCNHCGKTYETFPSVRLRFCSSKCANTAKTKGENVACIQCNKSFWRFPSDPTRKYCSISCAITARNLTDANPSKTRDLRGANNPMFGKGQLGPQNPMYGRTGSRSPRWKGGRKVRKDGYILVQAPENHPYPADTNPSGTKYILEHRLVMEAILGRFLQPKEVVHHLNENPSDNRPENLALCKDQSEHLLRYHSTGSASSK